MEKQTMLEERMTNTDMTTGAGAGAETKPSLVPIYNFCAHPVGWLESHIAFDSRGYPVAFIEGGSVFAAKNGHYLGQFHDGLFRDRLGCIVAFLTGSHRGAVLPFPQVIPIPPAIRSRSIPGQSRLHADLPHPAKPLLNKSSLDWEHFVAEYEAHWPWETRQ